MRVPVLAPALVRSHRGGPARRFGGGRTDAYGVSPSQYEGEEDEGGEDQGDEGGAEGGAEGGDEGGNETESSVESD
jgi:hypothetical protein